MTELEKNLINLVKEDLELESRLLNSIELKRLDILKQKLEISFEIIKLNIKISNYAEANLAAQRVLRIITQMSSINEV